MYRSGSYESEFTRIRSYIVLAPLKCASHVDFGPIFDPIIIAKCSQMVTGHIGVGFEVM